MNELFFALIRVALGTETCLPHTPSPEEWKELYRMAKKQSLLGICFAGVQRLQSQQQCPPVEVYDRWMGMSATIQMRNKAVDRQCVELQGILSEAGMRSSILKGQGVAQLYDDHLSSLRQSGDIDIYVEGGMKKVLAYCNEKFGKVEWDYINAHIPVYKDTEVELHWRVHSHPNLFKNKRLQNWFAEHELSVLQGCQADLRCGRIVVPTTYFNAFFILLHCYHHMFESGLGLRQLMDYYFVLRAYDKIPHANNNIAKVFREFGMEKFASAVMWIMKDVFGLEGQHLLFEANEKEGRFILNEVMMNGNFGHHDERKHKIKNQIMEPFATRIQHNWHLATHYPSEFLWSPIWLVWHFAWKRLQKR